MLFLFKSFVRVNYYTRLVEVEYQGEGGMVRKSLGWILVVSGLLIVGYPFLQKVAYDRQQQQLLTAFDQLGAIEDRENFDDQESALSSINEDQSLDLKGARGIITIGKIDLEMLIFEGASETELSKGVGMIEPQKDFFKHNVGLAGHRAVADGKQFNRLDELSMDDEIQVNTLNRTLHYRVTDTFIVHKTEVSVLEDQENPHLTLVTCTPLGSWHPTDRLIVQAELQDITQK